MRAEETRALLLEDETATNIEPLFLPRRRGLLACDHEGRILERSEVRRIALRAIREGVERPRGDRSRSCDARLAGRLSSDRDGLLFHEEERRSHEESDGDSDDDS